MGKEWEYYKVVIKINEQFKDGENRFVIKITKPNWKLSLCYH